MDNGQCHLYLCITRTLQIIHAKSLLIKLSKNKYSTISNQRLIMRTAPIVLSITYFGPFFSLPRFMPARHININNKINRLLSFTFTQSCLGLEKLVYYITYIQMYNRYNIFSGKLSFPTFELASALTLEHRTYYLLLAISGSGKFKRGMKWLIYKCLKL